MPYINDVLEENRGRNETARLLKSGPRPTRFTFDPAAVVELLEGRIVAQPEMYGAVGDMLHVVKADFAEPNRPLAVFLFLGSSGVGKTETVRVLAEAILGGAEKLLRIDMNTLAQEHYSAAITGAPPGYVGSKENHSLLDFDKIAGSYGKPGIVLFDEVEKASPGVTRTLLNVLDAGFLRLAAGTKEVSFTNCMIFMTSNQGAGELEGYRRKFDTGWRRRLGMKASKKREREILQRALRERFEPEFLNRIDRTVFFDELGGEWVGRLLDAALDDLNRRLARQGLRLEVDEGAREFLVEGYDEKFGARDLARCVKRCLEPALARALLEDSSSTEFHAKMEGGEIVVRGGG